MLLLRTLPGTHRTHAIDGRHGVGDEADVGGVPSVGGCCGDMKALGHLGHLLEEGLPSGVGRQGGAVDLTGDPQTDAFRGASGRQGADLLLDALAILEPVESDRDDGLRGLR